MAEYRDPAHRAVQTAIDAGLEAYADELNAQSDKFTPTWRENLRSAKYWKKIGPGQYVVITGDGGGQNARPVAKYVARQYYDEQRHRGDYTSGLKDLTALYRGTNGPRSKRRTDMGDRYLYGRAYAMAVREGTIQKIEAPLWYERAQPNTTMQKKRARAFSNQFRSVK